MTGPRRYAPAELRAFCTQALARAGARPGDADLVADGLIAADLRGVHSHGALRIGIYVDRLRAGSIDPGAELEIVRDAGAVAVADAHAGLGIAMAARAMDLAIARARAHGIAAVGVRNGNHCGMLAQYALRATAAGQVGIAASNADAQVAPWGARAKFLGTNPLAVAVPAGDEPPIVLDMATSVVAHAKVKGAADRGESIPPDWAVDPSGNPTTDPAQALAGALLPFGGPKGSGISILIDLLAGILPGGRSGPEIVPLYQRLDEPQGVGHLFMALRIDAFCAPQAFAQRVDETVRRIRALPAAAGAARAYLPGELEHLRARESRTRGIPLPSDAVAEVERTAALVGLAAPRPLPKEA
ncbi:MAG: Ldh family oxidoreductase [Burkholderiales bacterium]|nr:Ldh family oxidoreductase [Burkholderiales bacterium]